MATNDEGRPASRPHVNTDAVSSDEDHVISQHDINIRPRRSSRVVPQHVVLPTALTGAWASEVVLSPPGRDVLLDGLDCQSWTADGVQNLALRLAGRCIEFVEVKPALAFWLSGGLNAVEARVA